MEEFFFSNNSFNTSLRDHAYLVHKQFDVEKYTSKLFRLSHKAILNHFTRMHNKETRSHPREHTV